MISTQQNEKVIVRAKLGMPYAKQHAFITRVGTPDTGPISTHFQAGRGTGKTQALCIKAFKSATKWNRGSWGMITFQTYADIIKTFLKAWRKVSPDNGKVWWYHKTDHVIHFVDDPETQIHLYSRQDPDSFRGPEYGWGIDDESATETNLDTFENIDACIREPCPMPFHDSTSTPKLGLYSEYIQQGAHTRVIQASSFENPYRNVAWLAQISERMDPDRYRQEIMAEIISLSGMAWKNFADKRYPKGNRHWATFDSSLPWYIAADAGLYSAYLIIQRHPADDINGRRISQGLVDVVVGEYTPTNEDTRSTINRIKADYPGKPLNFCTGTDTEHQKSYIEGSKAAEFIRGAWPNVDIRVPHSLHRFKDVQYDRFSGLICNFEKRRRFLVSEKIVSHDQRKKGGRGILQVMAQDQFPSKSPRRGQWLPDNNGDDPAQLRHMRDAGEYWSVGMYGKTY